MREVERGVWHWEAPHPDWSGPENEALRQRLAAMAETPNEAARVLVSCYAIDDGDLLLFLDPLAVPRETVELAAAREPVVVLTSPWHERDTRSLVERLDARVFTPPPDEGSPDVAWLLEGEQRGGPVLGRRPAAHRSRGVPRKVAQRRRPVDGEPACGHRWRYARRLRPGTRNPGRMATRRVTRSQVADGLEMLLDLPVEVVFATHGGPTNRAALVRALA